MNILHVIPSFVPAWRYGGPVHALFELTRELSRQGQKITVMTTDVDVDGQLDVPLGQPVALDDVEVWYFPVEKPIQITFSRALGHALRDQVARFDVVHIHSVFNWPTSIAAHWARRRDVPYIIRPAGSLDRVSLSKSYNGPVTSLVSRAKKWAYFNTLARIELEYAAAIHFTTEEERRAALPLRLRAPSIVVPLGVHAMLPIKIPEQGRLRDRYRELGDRKIVLYLSRIDPVKGLDLLIESLGRLAKQRDDFAFVIAGDGPLAYRREIISSLERHGMRGRTVLLGSVFGEEKWRVLAQADIFALTSHHENFGLAVVEALAAGTPVVISDRVNIHREIENARAGFVTKLDADAIANAIARLLDGPDLRREMGLRARLLATHSFSWRAAAEKLSENYARIAHRPAPLEGPRDAIAAEH